MNNPQRHLLKIYHFVSLPCLNPLVTSFSLKKNPDSFPRVARSHWPDLPLFWPYLILLSLCSTLLHCIRGSFCLSCSFTALHLFIPLLKSQWKATSSGRPSLTTSLLLSCQPITLFSLAVITIGYFFMRKGSCFFIFTSTWKVLNKCVG